MIPIFNDYINFLENNCKDVSKHKLKEGFYWFDKQIIKCIDTNGNIQKILRLQINDDLNISIKKVYKNKAFKIESWEQTVSRNYSYLIELEENAKRLIANSISESEGSPIILSSTGKDSMVVDYLVKQISSDVRAIFSNTSLDVADTYKFAKSKNLEIINPDEGFYQYISRVNFIPSRMARGCCSVFKEGVMIDKLDHNKKYMFFMGMRNQESNSRSGYNHIWQNKKWGNRDWIAVLPIVRWSEIDIWLYTFLRKIDINPKYKKGYGRAGCAIACPFYTKSTWVLDKYWYPKQFKRWHNILNDDFTKNNKDIIMNCTQKEYHVSWNGSPVRDHPTQEVIELFAKRSGLTIEIAKKYFNHRCFECGKKVKTKNEIGINLKYFGRNTTKFLCKKHLIEYLGIDKNEYDKIIENFKLQNCDLF